MKKSRLSETASAAVFFLSSASFLNAQSSTVEAVPGLGGRAIPSASSILTPHVTEGLFGTATAGGYLAPSGEEGRFSSNALLSPSGEFIGMQSDADKVRSRGDLQRGEDGNYELSERDQLLLMRKFRNTMNTQAESKPAFTQRTAQPYTEEELYGTYPEETPQITQTAPMPSAVQKTAPEPERQPASSEDIWMRGSSRRQVKAPISQEVFSGVIAPETAEIDSAWYSFGTSDQSETLDQEAPAGGPPISNTPVSSWSDETGGYIGGQLRMPPAAAQRPSESLAKNGRKEARQTIQKQEQLETLLLQSPVVNPLSPIRVVLHGTSAVVTGVVPSDDAKIEAGKILLENEGIESVDNRLAVCGTADGVKSGEKN